MQDFEIGEEYRGQEQQKLTALKIFLNVSCGTSSFLTHQTRAVFVGPPLFLTSLWHWSRPTATGNRPQHLLQLHPAKKGLSLSLLVRKAPCTVLILCLSPRD